MEDVFVKEYFAKIDAAIGGMELSLARDLLYELKDSVQNVDTAEVEARLSAEEEKSGIPTELSANTFRDAVQLEWRAAADESVRYTVIRKLGEKPCSYDDGETVAKEIAEAYFSDGSIKAATEYFYAVYATKGGKRSPIAYLSMPVILYADVFDIRREKVENGVKMTWSVPENVSSVEVYRKLGTIAPGSRRTGDKIAVNGLYGFTDYDYPKEVCSYLIVCKYDRMGREYYSRGAKMTCQPYVLPSELRGASISPSELSTEFFFAHAPLEKGSVRLYAAEEELSVPLQQPQDLSEFTAKEYPIRQISLQPVGDGKLRFSVPVRQILHIYPIVSNEQLCVVYPPTKINTVLGISDVTYAQKTGTVAIGGTLDDTVVNVIAAIGSAYVSSPREALEKRNCSADVFRKEGLSVPLKSGVHYITLFTEFSDGNETVLSGPTRLPEPIDTREKQVVYYTAEYEPSVSSAYKIKLTFSSEHELELPAIDLIAGFPKPLSRTGGALIATIEGGPLKKKFLKSGFTLCVQLKAERANSTKDKLSLFFHEDTGHRIQLKEVQHL